MEAGMKLDRSDRHSSFSRTNARASAGSPIPACAWVKSAPAPGASNDEWNRDARTPIPHNASAASTAAAPAACLGSGRDWRREAPDTAPHDCNDFDQRPGLILAGALLAVIAWIARGTSPLGAALIVAMFAAAFMGAALANSLVRWRKPQVGRVIDVMPARRLLHAIVAFPGTLEYLPARAAVDATRPIGSADEASPGHGTPRQPRGRSAYDGLADE
jgi:hypothetical protein